MICFLQDSKCQRLNPLLSLQICEVPYTFIEDQVHVMVENIDVNKESCFKFENPTK